MGLFGFIGAAIGAVGSFISGAVSFIGSALSTVGPVISGFAGKVLEIVASIPKISLETVKEIVNAIATILECVCNIFGITENETCEELGAKATQEGVKSIDEFDGDAKAYIDYLRNEVKLDKERFDKLSQEDKLGCKALGISMETKAVEQEIGGVKISPEYLAVMATINNSEKMNIDGQSFIDVTESLKKSGITDMKDVSDYFEHKGNADPIKTGEALTEAFGRLDGVDDPYKKIDEIDKVLNVE